MVPLAPVAKHLTVAGAKDISIEEAILVVFVSVLLGISSASWVMCFNFRVAFLQRD